ncbi:hypothetical protein [Streptomyces fulvoviolaceus]|uniref:Rv1733c family protein n=1 Tax=Streptomyces fulvoviolaceus TaxID=285535 RepID=UPI000A6927DB|nr:hypothetical protein [Streptomyces fulvoviolaceus]MCT9075929.1 hypothetical protein [Streptomyces fulvoviolaceus]
MRLWRWRSNPLRRRSDLVEAWIVLAGWVFALVGGLLVGLATADAVEAAAERQRAQVHEVSAVRVEDDKDRVPARATTDYRMWATVRWTEPDGSTYTDEARVPSGTRAGSTVTVWADANGHITAEPLTDGETRLHAVAGGVLAAVGAGGAVLGAGWVVRLRLEQRRLAQWAAEWERIDTRRGWRTG